MSKKNKTKSRGAVPKVDPYLDGLMSKLMERLGALERKMDMVIAHATASRPAHSAPQAPRPVQQQAFSNPHPMVEAKNLPRHDRRAMYEAVCADCSDPCEVPFRPSPDRPIYCKPCFAKRKAEGRLQAARPQISGPAPVPPPAAASGPASAPGASRTKPSKPSGKASKSAKSKPAPRKSGKK